MLTHDPYDDTQICALRTAGRFNQVVDSVDETIADKINKLLCKTWRILFGNK